jgi:hypothetical protein
LPIEKTLSPGGPDPDFDMVVEMPEEEIDTSGVLVTETDDGGVVVDFDPMAGFNQNPMGEVEHSSNLADYIDDKELDEIAADLIGQYYSDALSRADWEKEYIKGLQLLGLKSEERTEPWNGASGVFHPMLTEAVVRFQAQTVQEVYPAKGPAKTQVVGKKTRDRVKQALRVQNYLNYLITEDMPEYRDELERLLFSLPIAGSAFKKVYFDQNLDRPTAMFVPAEEFVVSYGTASLTTCPRATHVMKKTRNEVLKLQVSGFYRDVDLQQTATIEVSDVEAEYNKLTGDRPSVDNDDRDTLLEMLVEIDLPGFEDINEAGEPTGIALPYVVTIDKHSRQILAIYRNWHEGDKKKIKRNHFVHYQYLPGLGFYGFGLVHMIGSLSKSATSLLRQLIDAGTLSNLPGGLKARGMKIKGDDTPIMPGEFRDVDVPGGTIKENIAFLPYKEPSTVLYQLLKDLVEDGRRFASAADVKAADINGEAPVGTTLAVLEREMKVMSAIQARIHNSIRQELRILAGLIKDYGPQEYPYETEDEAVTTEDFDARIDIIPVSDPNAGTMAQRIMQYQAALQLAAQAPQIYDMPKLHRNTLEALGVSEVSDIIPDDEDYKPMDPITENMEIIKGGQVKAYAYQDHEAHIQAHIAALENPKLIELLSMAPDAQTKQASMAAHVSEHLAFAYRDRIEKELGVELPNPDEVLPEDIEFRLSRLVAPAAAQLTGKDQREAQAKKQMEQAEDPVIQQRERELDIKDKLADAKLKEVENKPKETMAKISADLTKHRETIKSRESVEGARIGASIAKDNSKEQLESRKIASNEQIEGAKIGAEIAKELIDAPERNSGTDN